MIQLLINKEYENLVTPLPDEDYENLKQSIKDNGLWLPIITNEKNEILDGHHRFKICQELGIKLKHAVRKFTTKAEEFIFVGECNLKRRQLTILQRIEIVNKLKPYYEDLAKKNLKKAGKGLPTLAKVDTREELAKKAKTSHGTFDKGNTVLEKASQKDIDAINKGDKTITKVYREIKKEEKKKIRHKEIQKIQVHLPKSIQLHNIEFQKLKIKPNSVSLIFTDPPYGEESLPLVRDLLFHAFKVLKDGGSLVFYPGHAHIDKVFEFAKESGLSYHWIMAVTHSGPSSSIFGSKVLAAYKPLLWFTKGKYTGEFVRDLIKSEFQGKELHEWAQSTVESDYYIKYMTIENEIVYDPFLGSGTFGVSAKKLKRQFIGCEVNKEHYETARRLISSVKV